MDSEKVSDAIDLILQNKMDTEFDEKENINRASQLVTIAIDFSKKLWDAIKETKKIEAGLQQDEEVLAGKNADTRRAILEIKKGEHEVFDMIDYYTRILNAVSKVEVFNNLFVDIFYKGKK